jgi:hypothetical protein
MGQKYTNISDLYQQVKLNESAIKERELTPTELKRREEIAKKLPIKDFEKRYGKERGMQVKMATATKMAKAEGFKSDAQRRAAFAQGYKAKGKKGKKEETELDEKYDLYHDTFSGAMQHAYDYAKKKLGITVDPKEIDSKVATGPRKPTQGKTNKYRLKGKGGNLQIQVFNKGGSKPFELNMYKEETELDEMIPKSTMYALVKDGKVIAKGSKRDMTSKMKKEGGKVYNAPSKKVGDTIKESLDEKFTKKDFAKNEADNEHTKNGVELVKMFGTSEEKRIMAKIEKNHKERGSIIPNEQFLRDRLVKKYYPKLKEEVEINEDGHQDVASAIRQCKTITEDAMQILQKLQTMSPEDALPTWWTNKLAVASNSMNKMRDYLLVPSMSEEVELDEKAGDTSDMKKLVGELQNASKLHLAQSKRVKAHVDMMKSGNLKGTLALAPIVGELEKASEAHKRQSKTIAKHMEAMSESVINEQPENEITVGNYTTKHFYMCGSAQTTMKKHADKEGAEELTRMQDMFYKMEKDAMDAGGASDEQKRKSQILYDKIMAKAKEVGIADEVDKYMKMHLDSMLKGDPKLGFGRTDIKESYQEMIARIMSQRSMR